MISGGKFIAAGGKFPDGCGAGAVRVWGGELDGTFERAGTRPANKACKSTGLGRAAAAAAAVETFALAGMSFTSVAGGDLKASLLVMEEKSFEMGV
jgi:hypothetical protein